MSFRAVVVAAGAGRRFGGPKHEAVLAGKPLWRWAAESLERAGASRIVVVGDVPGGVPGGERRRDSVAAGLAELGGEAGLVLVHDAARPLASAELARAVVRRLEAGDTDGVVPVLPVRDTVKTAQADDAGEWVTATLDRGPLRLAQTPQGFVLASLLRAHAQEAGDATDDASLVERAGGRVATVPGEAANLKVTYPEDLRLAEALLA